MPVRAISALTNFGLNLADLSRLDLIFKQFEYANGKTSSEVPEDVAVILTSFFFHTSDACAAGSNCSEIVSITMTCCSGLKAGSLIFRAASSAVFETTC